MVSVLCCASSQVGRFEPLLETFELGCQLVKDDITGNLAEQSESPVCLCLALEPLAPGTEVHVFGRKPLLLNVNPVILRRLQWYSRSILVAMVLARNSNYSSDLFSY